MTQPVITNNDVSGIPIFNPVYREETVLTGQTLALGTICALNVANKIIEFNSLTPGAAVAQVSTVSVTGTVGTANVNVNGTDYLATFNTNLTTTNTDFLTAHAAAILAAFNIVVTASVADLIFTANDTGKVFTVTITNVVTDLAGTVAATTAANIINIPSMVIPDALTTTADTLARMLVSGEVNNNNLVLVNSNDSLDTVINGKKISEHLRSFGIITTPVSGLSILDNQ